MSRIVRTLPLLTSLFAVLPAHADPVDINRADATTLAQALNGVGESKALAIVDYRDRHGPFRSAEELLAVKGIGERILELNRDSIRIE